MTSKKYCPDCNSFHIYRMKRTFIQKHILHLTPKYHCNKCSSNFSKRCIIDNKAIENPTLPYQEEEYVTKAAPRKMAS